MLENSCFCFLNWKPVVQLYKPHLRTMLHNCKHRLVRSPGWPTISLKLCITLNISKALLPKNTYFFVQSFMFWAPLNFRSIFALVGGSGGQFPLISSVKPPQKSTASCNCDEKLSWAKLLEIKLRSRNSVACIFSSFFCPTGFKPMTTSNFYESSWDQQSIAYWRIKQFVLVIKPLLKVEFRFVKRIE